MAIRLPAPMKRRQRMVYFLHVVSTASQTPINTDAVSRIDSKNRPAFFPSDKGPISGIPSASPGSGCNRSAPVPFSNRWNPSGIPVKRRPVSSLFRPPKTKVRKTQSIREWIYNTSTPLWQYNRGTAFVPLSTVHNPESRFRRYSCGNNVPVQNTAPHIRVLMQSLPDTTGLLPSEGYRFPRYNQ